jgi:hypothetical protein
MNSRRNSANIPASIAARDQLHHLRRSAEAPRLTRLVRRQERLRYLHRKQVPTTDTLGYARFHPFGNGKPQKRAGHAPRERRKPGGRQAPPFPESVIHRELAFQAQIPRQSRPRVLANQLRRDCQARHPILIGGEALF